MQFTVIFDTDIFLNSRIFTYDLNFLNFYSTIQLYDVVIL